MRILEKPVITKPKEWAYHLRCKNAECQCLLEVKRTELQGILELKSRWEVLDLKFRCINCLQWTTIAEDKLGPMHEMDSTSRTPES